VIFKFNNKKMSYKLSKKKCEEVVNRAANQLVEYCIDNNINYLITGSSGGLDSATTLGIVCRAAVIAKKKKFKLYSIGITMPCQSSEDSVKLGKMAIKKFKAYHIHLDLTKIYETINSLLDINDQIKYILKRTKGVDALNFFVESDKVAQGNVKARLRMMLGAYHVARMTKGIVMSTDNLSEFWMAFWTLHGDVGDYGIIQQILKGSELYDIASYLGVPANIINALPDDGLNITEQGDEGQLGATYSTVDHIMISLIQQGFDPNGAKKQINNLPEVKSIDGSIVKRIAQRAILGSFKRKGAIVLSRKSLGLLEIEDIKI
jgi:NAD+ synthase